MSFSGFFGKKKKEAAKTPQEAIQDLKGIQDMLTKKQEFLEKKIDTEVNTARKHGTKNKRAALQALARKKRYEKQLTQIDNTLTTLEFQMEALENASSNKEILAAMKSASNALKATHQDMDVDKVHDVMDDIQEQQELAREIADAVSNPVGFGHDYDEDELMAELEALQEEQLAEMMVDVGGSGTALGGDSVVASLDAAPAVPSSEPARARNKAKEDDELAELAAWAS